MQSHYLHKLYAISCIVIFVQSNNSIHILKENAKFNSLSIRTICLCNEYPITPHFCIVKLGCKGVYIFLIFALKQRLWVFVRSASVRWFSRVPTIYVLSKNKKKTHFFSSENNHFYSREILLFITWAYFRKCIVTEDKLCTHVSFESGTVKHNVAWLIRHCISK